MSGRLAIVFIFLSPVCWCESLSMEWLRPAEDRRLFFEAIVDMNMRVPQIYSGIGLEMLRSYLRRPVPQDQLLRSLNEAEFLTLRAYMERGHAAYEVRDGDHASHIQSVYADLLRNFGNDLSRLAQITRAGDCFTFLRGHADESLDDFFIHRVRRQRETQSLVHIGQFVDQFLQSEKFRKLAAEYRNSIREIKRRERISGVRFSFSYQKQMRRGLVEAITHFNREVVTQRLRRRHLQYLVSLIER